MRRLAASVAVLAAVLATARARGEHQTPPLSVPASRLAAALSCPTAFTHPGHEPVLLVHGTAVTAGESWAWNYAETLPALGFDVCTVQLPGRALGDIQVSAEYVVHAVRAIAQSTGRKVDVAGHSQGGLEPRWAVKWWPDVRALVDDLVTLATPSHGTAIITVLCPQGGECPPSVWQMGQGSRFLGALNAGDETPGAVSYTNVYSLNDELVQPAAPEATSALEGGANFLIQGLCPGRPVHHAAQLYDAAVYELVLDAFTSPGPASAARFDPAACADGFMPGVDAWDAAAGNALVYGNGAQGFANSPRTSQEPPHKGYVH